MQTVLSAINNETVNGVAKPLDAIVIQELGTGDIDTILTMLNNQNVGTYAKGAIGSSTGAGGVGLIYRTDTVQLINQQEVVSTSTNGAARGVMRYTLRPSNYDSSANFYIYGSHYKASEGTENENRRNVKRRRFAAIQIH